MQQVTVSLSATQDRKEVGDTFKLECVVSGILGSDVVKIIKDNPSGNIDILASSQGQPGGIPSHMQSNWFATGNPVTGGLLELNINGAMKSDTGDYKCTVLRGSTTLAEVPYRLDILFVPSSISSCTSEPPPESEYYDGDTVNLVCFALDRGNPTVNLTWVREDGGYIPETVATVSSGVPYGEVTVTLTLNDNGKRFICNARSVEFPDFHLTCFLPVYVIPRPTTTTTTTTTATTTKTTTTTTVKLSTTSKPATTVKTGTDSKMQTTESRGTITRSTKTDPVQKTSPAGEGKDSTTSVTKDGSEALKIGVIAGSIAGVILVAITVLSLCFLIRSDRCCGGNSKHVVPVTDPSATYYNNVVIDSEEMTQNNVESEPHTVHIRSPDGRLEYATVQRNSVNSHGGKGSRRSADGQDDPPPYQEHPAPVRDVDYHNPVYDVPPDAGEFTDVDVKDDIPTYYADLDMSDLNVNAKVKEAVGRLPSDDSVTYAPIQTSRM